MINLDGLDSKEWLNLNAKLQQKKNKLREFLAQKGILKKDKRSDYGNYTYFSEAAYKELFTELLSQAKLEVMFEEDEYVSFPGCEKMPNGRMVKYNVYLFDTETGFFEKSKISGEAMDATDKAGYKASTGALKYYLATNFMVATGDEPEQPNTGQKQKTQERKLSQRQIKILQEKYKGKETELNNFLAKQGVGRLEELPQRIATKLIDEILKKEREKDEALRNKPNAA